MTRNRRATLMRRFDRPVPGDPPSCYGGLSPCSGQNRKVHLALLSCLEHARIGALGRRRRCKHPCSGREKARNSLFLSTASIELPEPMEETGSLLTARTTNDS